MSRYEAKYRNETIPYYKGNPFIEALPPLNDFVDDVKFLSRDISCLKSDLKHSRAHRAHYTIGLVGGFFQPLSLHILLQERLSLLIRRGYVGRNPLDGSLNKYLQNGYEMVMRGDLKAFRFNNFKVTAESLLLIGCSGSGKTTTLGCLLDLYPQVIYHQKLNIDQVVYLKIDCSHNGSLKEICQNFFRALDKALETTAYEKKYLNRRNSLETLLASMSQVANSHALGLLVIDEIQHLRSAKSGGSEQMLNFFVHLVNTIGLPVVFVGTPSALHLFKSNMRSARRASGLGSLYWEPLDQGDEWVMLTNHLWKYQWLRNRNLVLSDDVRSVWYDLSQGVMDIVIKLFVLSQLQAIATGYERIDAGLMRDVYDKELKLVHPMLDALRSNDPEKIAKYSDLQFTDFDKRVLRLTRKINLISDNSSRDFAYEQSENDLERDLFGFMKDEFEPSRLVPVIKQIVTGNRGLSKVGLAQLISDQLNEGFPNLPEKKTRKSTISRNQWHELDSSHLRFTFSQGKEEFYDSLIKRGLLFDNKEKLKRSS